MTQARRDLKLAIAHNGEEPEYYNSSALIWAIMGQSARALSDLETYDELVDDDIPPYVLDTRAYVYLRQGGP